MNILPNDTCSMHMTNTWTASHFLIIHSSLLIFQYFGEKHREHPWQKTHGSKSWRAVGRGPRVRNYCGHGCLGENSQFHPSSLRIYQHQLEVHKLRGCVMDIIFASSTLMDAILRFFLGSNKSWVSKWIHGSYLRKNLAGNSKIMKLQDDLYIKYGLNGVWCITPQKKWFKSWVLHHPYDLCSWKSKGTLAQEIASLISRGCYSPLLSFNHRNPAEVLVHLHTFRDIWHRRIQTRNVSQGCLHLGKDKPAGSWRFIVWMLPTEKWDWRDKSHVRWWW